MWSFECQRVLKVQKYYSFDSFVCQATPLLFGGLVVKPHDAPWVPPSSPMLGPAARRGAARDRGPTRGSLLCGGGGSKWPIRYSRGPSRSTGGPVTPVPSCTFGPTEETHDEVPQRGAARFEISSPQNVKMSKSFNVSPRL